VGIDATLPTGANAMTEPRLSSTTTNGKSVVVVRYDDDDPDGAMAGGSLTQAAHAALVSQPDVDIVGFVPTRLDDVDTATIVAKAIVLLAIWPAAVTVMEVTDAVKRVSSEELIVGSVDRATLRWVRGPAFIRRDVLERALQHAGPPDLIARVAEVAGALAVL